MSLTLCCLLWARPDQEHALVEYEDRVLALIPEHGATVLSRVRSSGADGHPVEVQVYQFPSQQALDAYLADPRRAALSAERDAAVARTELFAVTLA
jgi:uncharacterized protein (DUF1330 family)